MKKGYIGLGLLLLAQVGCMEGSTPRLHSRVGKENNGIVWHVAPKVRGNGQGLDGTNAAAYLDMDFWGKVQERLFAAPVQVVFLGGRYTGSLVLSGMGNAEHVLMLSGGSDGGVVFDNSAGIASEGSVSVQLSLNGCQNMVVENLVFTGGSTKFGYAFRVTRLSEEKPVPSRNITVRNCIWHDLTGIKYGATGVAFGSNHVAYENCCFERIGLNSSSHMMYMAYDALHVSVVGCHFEDCSGTYVRFRAGSDHGTVSNCTFVSTQTYPFRDLEEEVFVEFPIFNDVDPGDEIFARYGSVTGNRFLFNEASPANRIGIRFFHKGYDPLGWNYLLTSKEGAVLNGSNPEDKKALLRKNLGIDFDEFTIKGNIWSNETIKIVFASRAGYGSKSKGWDSSADISDIVFP